MGALVVHVHLLAEEGERGNDLTLLVRHRRILKLLLLHEFKHFEEVVRKDVALIVILL